MSTLRVNKITDAAGTGPVEFTNGFSISSGKTISGDINVTGVCTASTFYGNGSGLTVENGVTNSKIFAITLIT